MGIIIGNFSDGWQNKARQELMKDSALFMCRDLSLVELGSLTCRRQHLEDGYFSGLSTTDPIENFFLIDVEGLDHTLLYYTLGESLYGWNSYTNETRTLSSSIIGSHVSYAPIKPVLSEDTYIYITDGVSMLCDNGVSTKTWGIDPPDDLVVVNMAGSGGGLAAGYYQYKYTFYDGDTGSESDPSVGSATTLAAANDEATVSQIGISTNDRVTKRRLYRTLVGGGTFYLVAPLNDNVDTDFVDGVADANLTSELTTDQGIPPVGDVVVSYKGRLFLAGDNNYPNRVYYSSSDKPDNFPSTNYLEVGTSDDRVLNMVVFEGKVYFIQTATISGLYGTDENTFAWHRTRSHVGVSARWSVAVGPDGVYFLGHDGVYRFDGLKSMRVSEPIDKVFGITAGTWNEVVDRGTVQSVCRACFLQGKYYILLPMRGTSGGVTNRVLQYDVFEQSWVQMDLECGFVAADSGRGYLYGGLEIPDDAGYYSVFELLSGDTGTDSPSPQFLTKSFGLVGQEQQGSRAIGWVRKFRVDCDGDWTLKFYVDGSLVHTQVLTDQSASTRYEWYDFGPKIKGRYLSVHGQATGSPTALDSRFRELEVV